MTDKRRGEIRAVSESELRQALEAGEEERRGERRVPITLAVELRLSSVDELRTIYTENISAGGLMFSIPPPVTIAGSVELTIELPDAQRVELCGNIRHVASDVERKLCTVGVQFAGISDEVRAKLEDALRDRPKN